MEFNVSQKGPVGPTGPQGNPGATPTIAVGTVTTLDPGQDATAEITGETPNLTLNLGIPEGPPGQDGVQLNDSAINTTEAWSSKKIVDTLCPAFTETGNPITCNPVEDYPLSAVVTLEPKQAGTGDPSPENVRPISGWDDVTVNVRGKNLFNISKIESTENITNNGDGSLTVITSPSSNGISSYKTLKELCEGITPGTYTLNAESTGSEKWVYASGMDVWYYGTSKTLTDEMLDSTLYFYASGVNTTAKVSNIQLEFGSTPTPYEPYQPGTTATLTLPETIYGGTVDAVTGVGDNTYIFKELAISDMNHTEAYPGWTDQEWVAQAIPGEIVDKTLEELGCEGIINVFPNLQFRITPYFVLYLAPSNVIFPGLTQSQIKEQYPDLKVQFCLKLATPEPFQATGNQALPAVAGLNTVYTDGDSLAVSGRQDLLYTLQTMQAQTQNLNRFIAEGGTR